VGECPICARGSPLDVLVELGATWATAGAEAPLPGYVCVVSKLHAVEPFELQPDEVDAFWRESMLVARAVRDHVRPAKMNYEIHGNTIPHLHLHLFPRYSGDQWLCLKTQRSFLETVSTGSGSDLVNDWSQKSLENIAC
jgi:diadenosine tetraphosphate (Ap4A) HIT family hydrolase